MFHLFKKPSPIAKSYDPAIQKPILRCSICTGEQVAGLKDIRTGKFQDVMLIKSRDDLNFFMEYYGLDSVPREY